ncbi:MAG: DUF1844 domain-containing protein [Candidatus Hydrogenedentes bacterium]|nr:DUF1844 domain-containing protein [Candidatus Hydrogenedentota bacterium]
MSEEEPKIIIDEDWKAQVQREREQAKKTAEEKKPEAPGEKPAPSGEESLFVSLISSLTAQTMFALGLIAEREAKEVTVDLGQARYIIDTLMMLRQKTKGNLTPNEEGHLSEAVAELQRIYVVRAQQVQESALQGAAKNVGKK